MSPGGRPRACWQRGCHVTPGAVRPHDPATVTGQHMVFSYEPTSLLLGTGAKHKTLVFIMTQLGPLAAACDPAGPEPQRLKMSMKSFCICGRC